MILLLALILASDPVSTNTATTAECDGVPQEDSIFATRQECELWASAVRFETKTDDALVVLAGCRRDLEECNDLPAVAGPEPGAPWWIWAVAVVGAAGLGFGFGFGAAKAAD